VLDECGEQYDSVSFSKNFQQWVNLGKKKLIFLIGGPYGLSKNIKNRANIILSLSKMTFTHQMVQLFLVEQIYRAITLINGENYHH
jgi:23S rRNA (pseudouridine1915-N3)-methyltransferase